MQPCSVDYLAAGGNRQSAAADTSAQTGLVAFGAGQNVAIWCLHSGRSGITSLLQGHTATVTAVKYISLEGDKEILITGSANGELRIWEPNHDNINWTSKHDLKGHDGSVNAIAVAASSTRFVTGGADAKVRLWVVDDGSASCVLTLKLTPRYIPLSLVLGQFDANSFQDDWFLVVGGTRNTIQIYTLTSLKDQPHQELQATLSGHEGWIRALSLWTPSSSHQSAGAGEMLLASCSNDKYIRIWRFKNTNISEETRSATKPTGNVSMFEQTLTTKLQSISAGGVSYSITFDALLLGHEDWVYSVAWQTAAEPVLLSASGDGSMAVWQPDLDSGIWLTTTRLGELSGQKGATTATGSSGGFWNGLWIQSQGSTSVAALGRTGGWRVWRSSGDSATWTQNWGVSGHSASVNGIAWATDGSYLLSTGSDQTTRLHAEWKKSHNAVSWHELARPQIHGYDLNCITAVTSEQFVSGADEKLLRVFDEPGSIARMLSRLSGVTNEKADSLPYVASIPVLGLSNKAAEAEELQEGTDDSIAVPNTAELLDHVNEPTTDDLLSRHTLWPEKEKLYGHGYEISEAAANADLAILATACKASSLDHAVIRLYDTNTWYEIKPPLTAHSLTVTRLAFSSGPNPCLLSVGRDRQWTIFKHHKDTAQWNLDQSIAKAHNRMILDCAWLPESSRRVFATAGRDKTVKIWAVNATDDKFELQVTIKCKSAATSTAITRNQDHTVAYLAVGEESGHLSVHLLAISGASVELLKSVDIGADLCPSKAINRLAWRPPRLERAPEAYGQLAVASADCSVRILSIKEVVREYLPK